MGDVANPADMADTMWPPSRSCGAGFSRLMMPVSVRSCPAIRPVYGEPAVGRVHEVAVSAGAVERNAVAHNIADTPQGFLMVRHAGSEELPRRWMATMRPMPVMIW
jgi:hypothetical protein